MILTSYPTNNSPALDDNIFRFEEVDKTTPQEVEYRLADGTLLGIKRYIGRSTIDSSPKCYISRLLDPRPLVPTTTSLLSTSGRQLSLYAAWDGGRQVSPTVKFLHTDKRILPPAVLGNKEQWRVIAAGESDEIALMLLSVGSVVVNVRLPSGEVFMILRSSAAADRLLVVGFDVDEMLDLILDAGAEMPHRFDLEIVYAQIPLATIHYRLVERSEEGVRLAWLASDGAIHYHTFNLKGGEMIRTNRSESHTLEGTSTLSLEAWSELSLTSGRLSQGEFEAVADVVTSPKVWRITSEGPRLQQLLSHNLAIAGEGRGRVDVTLRDAAAKHYL